MRQQMWMVHLDMNHSEKGASVYQYIEKYWQGCSTPHQHPSAEPEYDTTLISLVKVD